MRIIHDRNFLYVGTKGGGLVKIDKQSGKQTVLIRADGSMLVGSVASLYVFDGQECTAVYYTYVKKIRVDRDGRIWVACYDALNKFFCSFFIGSLSNG